MRRLAEIQESFLHSVIDRENSEEAPEAKRYRPLVATNHRNALSDSYPVVQQLVGEKYFGQLAWSYLKNDPPNDPNMNLYGGTFSEHLKDLANEKPELESLSYLPDLASFEWAIYLAGRQRPKLLSLEELIEKLSEENDPNKIFFSLNPSLSLLETSTEVTPIWEAHQKDEVDALEINEGTFNVAVWNDGERVRYLTIKPELYRVAQSMKASLSLQQIGESVQVEADTIQQAIGYALNQQWIADVKAKS